MKDEMTQVLEKAIDDMVDTYWTETHRAGRVLEAKDFPDFPGWAWDRVLSEHCEIADRELNDSENPDNADGWDLAVNRAMDKARAEVAEGEERMRAALDRSPSL